MSNEKKMPPNEKKPPDVNPFDQSPAMDLPWNMFLGKKNFSTGVLIFSQYFKRLGMPQNLNHGDWYYVNTGSDEAPNYSINLYIKSADKEDFTFGDLKFLSSGKYVRLPSLQDLLTIILMTTYNFSYDGGLIVDSDSQEVTIKLYSDTFNNEIIVHGKDIYEAIIQGAYQSYLLSRNLHNFGSTVLKGLVPPIQNEDNDE